MKKKHLIFFPSFIAVLMFINSCQKEASKINSGADLNSSPVLNTAPQANNKCRLVFKNDIGWFYTDRYMYNSEGLLDDFKCDLLFGGVYVYAKMQYDNKGKLVTGGISYDGVTYDDMVFEYDDKGRIIKETAYQHGTSNMTDLAINTYNKKGQIIRREDPVYDVYTTFEYDAVGNNLENVIRLISDNSFIYRRVNRYKQTKNPETARPGIPSYNWWYINEVVGPFEPTEIDEYWGDGVGGEFQVYDEDPSKTIISPTSQNLALDRLAFDNISGTEHYQYWEYENCGSNNEPASAVPLSKYKMDQRSRDIAILKMPLLRGPFLQKQLAERKAIVQRLKK